MILLVLITKNAQSVRTFDSRFGYIIILFGAEFNFAEVTENGILCWNIQLSSCVFCPFATVIQEIHTCRKDCFNKRKQKIRME